MALYEVSRTDVVAPGEFVNALVIAGGTALARAAVSHMSGVTTTNTQARRVDTVRKDLPAKVLDTYFDESPTLPADAPWGDEDFVGKSSDVDPATDYDSVLVETES